MLNGKDALIGAISDKTSAIVSTEKCSDQKVTLIRAHPTGLSNYGKLSEKDIALIDTTLTVYTGKSLGGQAWKVSFYDA